MAVHERYDPDCYGCQLRAKDLSYTAEATPTMRDPRRRPLRPKVNSSWEAGVAGEHRPDGSFVPYVHSDMTPIGVKEFSERSSSYEEQVRRLKTAPDPLSQKGTE